MNSRLEKARSYSSEKLAKMWYASFNLLYSWFTRINSLSIGLYKFLEAWRLLVSTQVFIRLLKLRWWPMNTLLPSIWSSLFWARLLYSSPIEPLIVDLDRMPPSFDFTWSNFGFDVSVLSYEKFLVRSDSSLVLFLIPWLRFPIKSAYFFKKPFMNVFFCMVDNSLSCVIFLKSSSKSSIGILALLCLIYANVSLTSANWLLLRTKLFFSVLNW